MTRLLMMLQLSNRINLHQKIIRQTGKGVREVVLEKGLLTAEQLDDILSVENLMNPTYKAKLNK